MKIKCNNIQLYLTDRDLLDILIIVNHDQTIKEDTSTCLSILDNKCQTDTIEDEDTVVEDEDTVIDEGC